MDVNISEKFTLEFLVFKHFLALGCSSVGTWDSGVDIIFASEKAK